jgi:RNA polymerase sigma-70 factor (ECF subfamily)
VRNFLRKLAGDWTLADDLAQDCFMHAWGKLAGFSGHGTFIGWLLKVAYTTFLQAKRKSKRYGEIIQEAGHHADMHTGSHTSMSEETVDLDKLLAVLEPEERAIMVMSYACGLSHREISDAVEHPVGTVKSIIFRSKEKIRANFEIKDHQHG